MRAFKVILLFPNLWFLSKSTSPVWF